MDTALITGASRGLGLALARELARRSWRLVIDARGAGALEAARAELAELTEVVAIPGDVTDAWHRQWQVARHISLSIPWYGAPHRAQRGSEGSRRISRMKPLIRWVDSAAKNASSPRDVVGWPMGQV